jgi:L-amino acid N-acyltransferase YncA/uncharacterized protein YhfF
VAVATSTFDTQPRDRESEREWYEAHRSPRYPVIVAEDDRQVVAWAALSPWSPRGGYRHTVEGSLFVREGYRGKGVGTLLTRELISRAASAGHHVLLARVETGNHQSRSLLMSHGFRSVGVMREVGRKFDRWLDNETFEMVLPPSGERPLRGGMSRRRIQFVSDDLVDQIVAGRKTASVAPLGEVDLKEDDYNDALVVGEYYDVHDSGLTRRATIRIVAMELCRWDSIPERLWRGEGNLSADEFRHDHEEYFGNPAAELEFVAYYFELVGDPPTWAE